MKRFLLIFSFLITLCSSVYSQTGYNAIATAYVTTTISQNVVFNSTMQQGGTFTFSVLAHNGGGRAGQSDTANVKIEFYTAGGSLVTSANTSYNSNLPNPQNICGNPCIDTSVPWSTLTISKTLDAAQAGSVAYARVSMYGVDGSFWAGDYGPWYRAPTFQLNGGTNLTYNPEFGPYNNVTAQGWTSNPGFGACQGAWGGSNACIVNSDGVPGTSTVGLVANANGGGPDVNGGTTSGTAGGYNSTMTVTNAGTGATAGAAPTAPTVTGTTITYTSRTAVSGNTTTIYRTPTTVTTYSDGTTSSAAGTEAVYQTKVSSTVVTNKVEGTTLTTYSTPINKVTLASTGVTTVEANGVATSSTQTVQRGLSYTTSSFDPFTYTCILGICGKNLLGPYAVPSLTAGAYATRSSGVTTNGPHQNVSLVAGSFGEGTLVSYKGTITIPVTVQHPVGSQYTVTFYSQSDNGYVMNINGTSVINDRDTSRLIVPYNGNYNGQGTFTGVAGQTYNFEAWYWNNTLGYGLYTFWNLGSGIVEIPNSVFTTGTIANITIDTTGLSYSDPSIVNVSGTLPEVLCCGGSSAPFNATSSNTTKVQTFVNRTTADSQVYIEQLGTQNKVVVEQSGTKNNYVNYYGNGLSNDIDIKQQGNLSTQVNYVDLQVIGNFNTVKIEQTSTGGAKGAFVNVQDSNNSLILKQQDSGSHYAEVNLSGGNKTVDILQQGSGNHMASVTLTGPQPASLNLIQAGSTQQYYSITSNCSTAGGCAPISVTQGR